MATWYPVGKFVGDRPEKILTRAFFYMTALDHVGTERFGEEHHLVLGGRGGDIHVLRAMGVEDSHIHVAEVRRDTCKILRTQFPGIQVHREDALLLLARSWRVPFATLNLDLCGVLSEKNLRWVSDVVHADRYGGALVGVTLCASRETEADYRVRTEALLAENEGMNGGHARSHLLLEDLCEEVDDLAAGPFVSYVSRGKSASGNAVAMSMCTTMFAQGGRRLAREDLFAEDFDLRATARQLRDRGLNSQETGAVLGVKPQQVAGWFAADTKRRLG